MRKLLLILILTLSFQTINKADDISDFQIEGMSVGDSLLSYFTESEIKKRINSDNTFFYKKDFMAISLSYKTGKFKTYDDVGVILKQNDKQYKIYSLNNKEGKEFKRTSLTIKGCVRLSVCLSCYVTSAMTDINI